MRVAVIVDDLDPGRRRKCFWEEALKSVPDVTVELVSLLAQMEERKFFDVYSYDVVIFNWCVLDGSLMYASDRVQCIVEFYDDHFHQFVRRGGTLIMENQPKRWRPSQKAYDVLLPGELRVTPKEPYLFGSKVFVNERLKRHPLVQHLPECLDSCYSHPLDESWFPPASTSNRSIQELHPTKVYSGGFTAWRGNWLPLLYDENRKFSVMVVKTEGLGVWVVTTMFLGSSNIGELVESLVVGSRRHDLAIQSFHERHRTRRKVEALALCLVFLLLAVGVYALLSSGLVEATIPYGSTVGANIVFSALFTLALSLITVMRRRIVSRIRAILNR